MKRLLRVSAVIVTFGTIGLAGCGKVVEASPRPAPAYISVLPSPVSLATNQSTQLTAMQSSGQNSSGEDITKTATWESSSDGDLAVANGKVSCKHAGNYVVTVSTLGLKASSPISCVTPVAVQPPPSPTPAPPAPPAPPAAPATPSLTGIMILNPPKLVRSNAPSALNVQGTYDDKSTADVTKQIIWKSDKVARIDSNGHLYCNVPGTSTIIASMGSYTSTAQVECLLKSVTAPPGFVEHVAEFYGPFPSWLNVKTDFGAKGDGITDDTRAFQAALIGAWAQKKTLFVPDGLFILSATIRSIETDNMSIIGADPKTTHILWKGAANGTMSSFDGCSHFRISRIWWDSNNGLASVGVHLGFDQKVPTQRYPTFDSVEDSRFTGFTKGVEVAFAGETTINRVHFDHTTYGVSAVDYNALNLNVIDSLFTDNAVGITNDPGAGAFNVSNSVFVRSTVADMKMGNAQAFSIRHNLSVDSQAFFVALNCNCGAAVTLEGNVIRSAKGIPITFGNQGPLMLVDNSFELPADPQDPIFMGTAWKPTFVFSLGNQFSTSKPFQEHAGSEINLTEVDEAPMSSVPVSIWQAPDEVYIPAASTASVFEAVGNGTDAIQNAVTQAKMSGSKAVVHIAAGDHFQNTTLDVPDSPGLAIVGDGQTTNIIAGSMLSGPVVRTHGSVELEGMVLIGSITNPSLQGSVDDKPSTYIFCDLCTTIDGQTGFTVSGLDHAMINTRATTLNGGASLAGGYGQASGLRTLGRFNAFMSTSDTYRISKGGHFLISDGFHDAGQQSMQAQVSGGAVVTHEGGAICTPSPNAVQAVGLTGQLSIVGVAINTTVVADKASTGTLGMIASLTGSNGTELSVAGSSIKVVHGGDDLDTLAVIGVVPLSTEAVVPEDVERALGQARTEFLVPRAPLASPATVVRMHRIMTARSVVGMSFSSNGAANNYSTYSVGAPSGTSAPTSCATGSISMNGAWALTAGNDGFYGLLTGGLYLANMAGPTTGSGTLGMVPSMTDAAQRWLIQPAGNGLFHVVNRADGSLLTRLESGCAGMAGRTGNSSQEWMVEAK